MKEFKIGDKVVCTLKESPDYFNVYGKMDYLLDRKEVLEVVFTNEDIVGVLGKNDVEWWYLKYEDIELYEEQTTLELNTLIDKMKLSDLKQGMICELRNKDSITILNNGYFLDDDTYFFKTYSNHYKDDLTHKADKMLDIMKVSYGDKVVWERKESTYWEPKDGERYYHVGNFGYAVGTNYDGEADERNFNTNLVFKTREEAKRALLKQQAKMRVIKEIARLNEGWKPNWNDTKPKYYIVFSHLHYELNYDDSVKYKHLDNNLYLKSWELAHQLIETHEKDLKLMLEV